MVYYDCDKPTNPKVNHTRYVLYTLKDTFVCNEHITDMWLLLSSHVVDKITHHIDEQDFETTTSQESKPHYDAVSSVSSSEDNHQVSSDVNVTEDSDKEDISKDHKQTFCETDTICCSILPDTSSDTNIQKTPIWSTFNSLIGEPQPIWNVGIAAPSYRRSPTEWPVLLTILMQAQHINCITVGEGSRPIVTLDGDLYDRAVKIKDYKEKCSGLDFAWESSDIYGSATVRQILDGRHVYRCLEAHTMTLLALQLLYQKVVFEEFEVDEMETRIKQALDTFKGYTDGGTDRKIYRPKFLNLPDKLQKAVTCMQVKVLLIVTAATRSADWKLHLSTTEELLHYFHAHDQYNYGRWGPLYVADMLELQLTDSDTWSFLDKGNFVISKHSVPFTAIDPDHAIEQEHEKMKMKEGFIGITGNEQAMEKHFVIAPNLSRIVQEFKEYAGIDNRRACSLHHELTSEKSSKLVRNAAKLVGNINMQGNPFLKNDMYNLMTFAVAPDDVSKDIEYRDQHGKEALQHFVSTRMVNNTVEFWGAQKRTSSSISRILLVIAKSRPEYVVKDAIGNFEFNVTPPSNFHPDGSMIMLSSKSQLVPLIMKMSAPGGASNVVQYEENVSIRVLIIDAMCLGMSASYDELRIVFDQYISGTLKETTREKRSLKLAHVHYHVNDDTEIKSIKSFLAHIDTKAELTTYLSHNIISHYRGHIQKVLVMHHTTMLSNCPLPDIVSMPGMSSGRHSLEEGDQLVLLNACDVMHKDPQSFLDVFSVDTDVFVLLTGHYKLISKSTTLIRRGSERLSIRESYSTWAEKSRRSYWLLGDTCAEEVPELRWMLFAQKSKEDQGQLPPTLGSLVPHTARAYHVSSGVHMALIWKTSKEPCPQFPPPTDYFWELVDGRLKPVYCTNLPAPETLLELRKCSCKTGCTKNSCGCKKNNLECTDMCGCGELCQNIYHESPLDVDESD
ncbi:hypothetical protein GQR58_024329 [Nymphon striatum]|nr:hypothetical protein GQR58_024329 [Nymphon striatum]